jgi:hypothetical protein
MRTTLVLAVIGLAVSAGALAAPPLPPTLRLTTAPLTIRGSHFRPHEQVTLTVVGAGARAPTRKLASTAAGTFVTRFSGVTIERCQPYLVRAVGTKGSRATLRGPFRAACGAQPGFTP